MSSGKVRRDRSGSQERHSRKEGDKRTDSSRRDRSSEVHELNEEEYDEGWEHEWEDIDEIDKGTKYQKSYGKNQNQKWRGKNSYRGQNRFNNWEYRNRAGGSDNSSENNRKSARKSVGEEDETLEMSSGVEIKNLKVKIQDGKRFAEPDEFKEIELGSRTKHQPRFSRGRGSRGHHSSGRDRWNQNNRYKHSSSDDLVDCREVLNRRKRRYSDNNESDLREKLLRKEEMGDLREIIESRDPGLADLRDIIEPPDMSLMDEFTEDDIGEDGMVEDINLRIHNEYFVERPERVRELDSELYEGDRDSFDFIEEHNISHEEVQEHDIEPTHREEWPQDRWRHSSDRSRERSFDQVTAWPERNRREPFPEDAWRHGRPGSPADDRNMAPRGRSPRMRVESGPPEHGSDPIRNRSRERVRSPPVRSRKERSFDRGVRPRDSSWELDRERDRERPFSGRGPPREREPSVRMEERGFEVGRRSFSPNRILTENERIPIMDDDRGPLRSPIEPDRRRDEERNHPNIRNIGQESSRMMGERKRRSPERIRDRRMIDQEENRSIVPERVREMERNRSPLQNRNWGPHGEEGREGIRALDQVRNRTLSRERNQVFDREGNRGFDRERSRSFDRARKRSVERVRNMPWDHNRSISRDRSLDRVERVVTPVRNLGRRQGWIGPRTPSEESFRETVWEQPRSPPGSRGISPPRERSRSRGRPVGAPTGRQREHSRGREPQERIRDPKEKSSSRPKEPERKDKTQEQNRRRDYNQAKSQDIQPNKPREPDSRHLRMPDKDSSGSYKSDRNRKRELEENAGKDRVRGRPRTPERRAQAEKIIKKTPQMLIEEFKEKHVRQSEKPEKFNRREDYLPKQGRDTIGQDYLGKQGRDGVGQGRGHNQQDSKEWENIRDFQERRTVQPVVGLPFLDEARRQRENLSHDQQLRNQGNRQPRNAPTSFVPEGQGFQGFQGHQGHQGQQGHLVHAGHSSSSGNYQHKDQPVVWQNQSIQQSFNLPEDERRQQSRWGSPGRQKLSSHIESHKSAPHTSQSIPKPHHPPSNGKPDDNFWRRNLPSLGEPQWNNPRSDLSNNPPRDAGSQRPASFAKGHQSAKEVIFVRGLARDVSDMDIRKDISDCGLWPKDVRVVTDAETGASRGLAFITFNSVDEATRWMDLRGSVLNLRPNNHAAMDYSNPISRDWECIRCHTMNFKYRINCYQCSRTKEDCLDGWEETCPYPTNALLLRGLNPLSSISDITKSLKSRMLAQARLDGVKMGVDVKGRPRSVCFVQLTSVTDSMSLHKSLLSEPLIIDNCQVIVAYCQLDKLPLMDSHPGKLHPPIPIITPALPPAIPLNLPSTQPTSQPINNIPVVTRAGPAMPPPPKPVAVSVSTATIRSMLEGNYTEKDIPTLAQYCASAYAKNPQEQAAYIRYYTKHYRDKLHKGQASGK